MWRVRSEAAEHREAGGGTAVSEETGGKEKREYAGIAKRYSAELFKADFGKFVAKPPSTAKRAEALPFP